MRIASGRGLEHMVFACLVAAEQQQVADAQQLQVDELVFDLFLIDTRTNDVGYDGNVVMILYSSSDSHCAGASPDAQSFKLSVAEGMVDILTVMSRDVDVMGLVILYPLDVAEKRPGAVAFEGGSTSIEKPFSGMLSMSTIFICYNDYDASKLFVRYKVNKNMPSSGED